MRKIVKHVSTRWLSLEKCIGRLLQQWPALLQYFESEQSKFGHSSKTKSTQSTSKNKATHSRGSDMSTHSKEKPTHSGSSKVNSGFDLAGNLFRQQNLAKSSQATKRPAAATTQPKTAATRPKTCSTAATQPKTWAQKRVKRACEHLKDPAFKLYCYFLSAVLPIFDEANTLLLQQDQHAFMYCTGP